MLCSSLEGTNSRPTSAHWSLPPTQVHEALVVSQASLRPWPGLGLGYSFWSPEADLILQGSGATGRTGGMSH